MDKQFAETTAEMHKAISATEPLKPHDIEGRREVVANLAPSATAPELPDEVEHSFIHATTEDGFQLPILRVKRKDQSETTAAVLHIHGGGFISLSANHSLANLANLSKHTGVQFFSVDYRLAPEHPYPIPMEDCWTGLKYVVANAAQLKIDPARMAVMGESAGGGLAAGLALLARDRKHSPPLTKQIIMFPMIDDTNEEKLDPSTLRLWGENDTLTGWTAYLGSKRATDDVPIYAAPSRAKDVSGLPPLYMDVGQLDLFVKENYEYAGRFISADIETEMHVFPGLPHAYGIFDPDLYASKQSVENRIRILKQL